jgi:hypothetical protein
MFAVFVATTSIAAARAQAPPAPASQASQTPVTQPPSTPSPGPSSASPASTPPAPKVSPAQHLANAGATLGRIPDTVATRSEARRALADLRKDFAQLVKVYKPSDAGWVTALYAVERDLVVLIGGGGPEVLEPTALAAKTEVSDPATRDALKAFRTEVELFYDVAMAPVQ